MLARPGSYSSKRYDYTGSVVMLLNQETCRRESVVVSDWGIRGNMGKIKY